MGLHELTEEQRKIKEEAGVGVDERFIQAMYMKNVMGPVQALVNQSLQGIPFTKELIDFIQSSLPPLNPNKVAKKDSDMDEGS